MDYRIKLQARFWRALGNLLDQGMEFDASARSDRKILKLLKEAEMSRRSMVIKMKAAGNTVALSDFEVKTLAMILRARQEQCSKEEADVHEEVLQEVLLQVKKQLK